MKVAVIGANGKSGSRITKEALRRGMDVTAVVRSENKSGAPHMIQKDLFDLEKEDLAGFDAVVDAFAIWDPSKADLHVTSLAHLTGLLAGTNVRLLVVGGAGSLYTNKEHTAQVSDARDIPPDRKPTVLAMGKALEELRKVDTVRWTYVSPATEYDPAGPRTGDYILAGEELTFNSQGKNYISYDDYALAMVDEIEKGNHIRQRISVLAK